MKITLKILFIAILLPAQLWAKPGSADSNSPGGKACAPPACSCQPYVGVESRFEISENQMVEMCMSWMHDGPFEILKNEGIANVESTRVASAFVNRVNRDLKPIFCGGSDGLVETQKNSEEASTVPGAGLATATKCLCEGSTDRVCRELNLKLAYFLADGNVLTSANASDVTAIAATCADQTQRVSPQSPIFTQP